jgi:tetratricopeptide (TPR) repeat protein
MVDGDWSSAHAHLLRAAGALKGDDAADAFYQAARCALTLGDYDGAASGFTSANTVSSPHWPSQLWLYRMAVTGMTEPDLKAVKAMGGGYVARALGMVARHDEKAAMKLSKESVGSADGDALTWAAMNVLDDGAAKKGGRASAKRLESMAADSPWSDWWLTLAARQYGDAGMDKDQKRCLALVVGEAEAQDLTGEEAALYAAEDYAGLVQMMREHEPNAADGHRLFLLGMLSEMAGAGADALSHYVQAFKTDKSATPAYLRALRLQRAMQDHEGAVETLTQWVEAGGAGFPVDALRIRLASELRALDRTAEAVAALESVLDGDGSLQHHAQRGLAVCYRRAGQWAELGRLYATTSASVAAPERKAAFMLEAGGVGPCAHPKGEQARKYLEKALDLDSGNVGALDRLAELVESSEHALEYRTRVLAAARAHDDQTVAVPLWGEALLQMLTWGEDSHGPVQEIFGSNTRDGLMDYLGLESGQADAERMVLTEWFASATDSKTRSWLALEIAVGLSGDERAAMLNASLESDATNHASSKLLAWSAASHAPASNQDQVADYSAAPTAAATRRALGEAVVATYAGRHDDAVQWLNAIGAAAPAGEWPSAVAVRLAERLNVSSDILQSLVEKCPALAGSVEGSRLAIEGRVQVDITPPESDMLAPLVAEAFWRGTAPDCFAKSTQPMAQTEGSALEGWAQNTDLQSGLRGAILSMASDAHAYAGASDDAVRVQVEACRTAPTAMGLRHAAALVSLQGAQDDLSWFKGLGGAESALWLDRLGQHRLAGEGLAASTLSKDLQQHLLEPIYLAAEQWEELYQVLTSLRKAATGDEAERLDRTIRSLLGEHLAGTDMAWEAYRVLDEAHPEDAGVLGALVRIAAQRTEFDAARGYFERQCAVIPKAEQLDAHIRFAGTLESAERFDDAKALYAAALVLDGQSGAALDGLSRVAEASGDWASQKDALRRRAEQAGEDDGAQPWLALAERCEKEADVSGALEGYRHAFGIDASSTQALDGLVRLTRDADPEGFLNYAPLLAAVAAPAEGSALRHEVGLLHLRRDDHAAAIESFRAAIAVEHPNLEAAKAMVEACTARGDWAGALEAYAAIGACAPEIDQRVSAWTHSAQIALRHQRDRMMASVHYERVLHDESSNLEALRYLSQHAYDASNVERALQLCDALAPNVADGKDTDDFDVRMELADFHAMHGRLHTGAEQSESAIVSFEKSLELNPSHRGALEASGLLYEACGDWKRAENVYRRVLQVSSGQGDKEALASMYASLGRAEQHLGKHEKAQGRFEKALELHANHVGAMKGLAQALQDLEDWNGVLNIYNRVIYHASQPNDVVEAYMTKGRILDEKLSRTDKAEQHYQRCLDFDSEQPEAYLRLAELTLRREDLAGASRLAGHGIRLVGEGVGIVHALLCVVVAVGLNAEGKRDAALEKLADARVADESVPEDFDVASVTALQTLINDRLASLHE